MGLMGLGQKHSDGLRKTEGLADVYRRQDQYNEGLQSDGKLIASASFDETVRLWDSVTGAGRGTLKGHSERVSAVAFSPDGKLIASASYDKTVRLWDSATGAGRGTLKGHSAFI